MRVLLAAALAATAASACTRDLECNLNGQCTGGACVCRPGWTGADCGLLDFLTAPTTHAFYRNTSASWGISVVEENGVWWAFLAFMEGNCGLNAWQPNSAIYRAVSSTNSPLGPYVNETKVLDWFAHNPSVSRHPDGSLLVWHIGNGLKQGSFNGNCSNGTTPPAPPPPPPPPQKLVNGAGQCLIPSGPYPCFSGAYQLCPLTVGDCSGNESDWSLEPKQQAIFSAEWPSAAVDIDCNYCTTGAVAKLFGSGASGLFFDATDNVIKVSNCPGMCLSNGIVSGAVAPCGGGKEPWMPTQIHVVPCNSSDAQSWTTRPGSRATMPRTGAPAMPSQPSLTWPNAPTDTNVLVSTSGSVLGPFVDSGIITGARLPFVQEVDNPAPLVFSNGSVLVAFRSWNPPGNTTTPVGIARSSEATWNSSYILPTVPFPFGPLNATEPVYVPLEDPYLWQDASSGTYHCLFHNMGGCKEVGCHAFSADSYMWYISTTSPYDSVVNFTDGSSIQYARRERPHLVFNSLGQPAFLTNGVQEGWDSDHSYSLIQPINVAWP